MSVESVRAPTDLWTPFTVKVLHLCKARVAALLLDTSCVMEDTKKS